VSTVLAIGLFSERYGASPMSITLGFHLKRKGASPPVSSRNLNFYTGQLALFRLK
jgi:hypothetical protein